MSMLEAVLRTLRSDDIPDRTIPCPSPDSEPSGEALARIAREEEAHRQKERVNLGSKRR